MKTLKGTVLSTFSYSQTQKLCAENPTVFDCDWGLWREKAIADFGISGEFFDLVPQLSGAQRYLQIKSYYVLTPDMAVRVYSDGYIEGVYETVAGYKIARDTLDSAMQMFFSNRLKPEQREILYKQGYTRIPLQPLSQEYIDALNSNKNYKSNYWTFLASSVEDSIKTGDQSQQFLQRVLESGRIEWLDQILDRYFVLPEGFSIQTHIPYTPFWAEEFPLYDLPLYKGNLDPELLFPSVIRSTDTRIVDFFRSIFRDRIADNIPGFYEYARTGFSLQKRPEETFGIYKRFKRSEVRYSLPFMVEQIIDLGQDGGRLITKEIGNVTTLLSLLPFTKKKNLSFPPGLYPLSEKIVAEYY
nr:hypothetical protein Clen_61 [Cedratvirus lena]